MRHSQELQQQQLTKKQTVSYDVIPRGREWKTQRLHFDCFSVCLKTQCSLGFYRAPCVIFHFFSILECSQNPIYPFWSTGHLRILLNFDCLDPIKKICCFYWRILKCKLISRTRLPLKNIYLMISFKWLSYIVFFSKRGSLYHKWP